MFVRVRHTNCADVLQKNNKYEYYFFAIHILYIEREKEGTDGI